MKVKSLDKTIEDFEFLIGFLKKRGYETIQQFPLRKYINFSSIWMNEVENLRRFLFKKNNLFAISLLPSLYSFIYTDSLLLFLRDGFFLNKVFPIETWEQFLPKKWIVQSQKDGLFRKEAYNKWRFLYRIVPYHGYFFVTSHFDRKESHFTFLSYDSLYFASFLSHKLKEISFSCDRGLDLCSGVGIQAFIISAFCQSVQGIDISQSAVQLANLNSALNGFSKCVFKKASLFDEVHGVFDLIVANPPFIFTKESKSNAIDSIGGEPFGLGVTRDILRQIPVFLSKIGRAFIITRSPVFSDEDYLLNILQHWLSKEFGWQYHHVSDSVAHLESYERELGITGYSNIIVEISRNQDRQICHYSSWHRKTSLF